MAKTSELTIVVVDLSVKQTSPAGSCVLSELSGLSTAYKVHLIASEADENIQQQVTFHKIEAPAAPLVLRYMVFSKRVKQKMKKVIKEINGPFIIQTTQGQYVDCTIAYPHFCHRAYLNKHWKNSTITGLRRITRKLNHLYHSKKEALAFTNAKVIVVPSKGLSRELIETYPYCKEKVQVIANPVDVAYFQKPQDFDGKEQKNALGIGHDEIVIAFAALGDFARKGLPELMGSLSQNEIKNQNFKILVIGGKANEIDSYKSQAKEMGILKQMCFVGFQNDIRPYLWLSNIFALPSLYEIFPLVCIQAAAAGLPLLASQMHGVEEYLENGKNGWLIERQPESIAKVLAGISEGKFDLSKMGEQALETVRQYDHESFRAKWLKLYAELV